MKRPNVVLLYTDQQRWDTIRAGGNPLVHTPNLDALAARGALLDRCYVNSPVCMPSRHSMLSGQYASSIGSTCNGIEMRPEVPTLHNILKPYGYHAANIGKLHFKNHSNRDHREPHPTYGFDTLILSDEPGCYEDAYIKWVRQQAPDQVENCRCDTPPAWTGEPVHVHPRRPQEPYVFDGPEGLTHTAFVAEETADFIRRHAGERFFAIAGFYAPHAPINPPQRFVDMYDAARMPLPARAEGENLEDVSDEQWRKVKAYYYALVSHIDDQVGRILSALDETGLREETIVIFTADHGEHLGDHGMVGKSQVYDSSSRVPLIVSYPGRVEEGAVRSEIIEHVDLAPTVLDWCGVQAPPIFQGRSFRALLEGGAYEARRSAFMEIRAPFQHSWKGLRTENYKYCVHNGEREQLFDLAGDPGEVRDVSGEAAYADALGEVRAELLRRWFDVEKQYPLRTAQY